MATRILFPRILRVGAGAFGETGDVLQSLGLRTPLIVTDPFLRGQGLADRLARILVAEGLDEPRIFSETVSDPTSSVVEAGVQFLQEGRHDSIIGLGGGSSIDTAKAIALLGAHGGRISDYKAPRQMDLLGLPIIAIPTTAGTGSEATRFTIVTEVATGEKMLCIGLVYLPTAALVDYELTLTKPMRLTADTGVDSLTHAIEAFVSRLANPFSDPIALSAMRSIWANLPVACFEPANRPAREAMMLAATQAGMAFSNSSVALVHAMSRPIGARFHVPHGLSNAMLLPVVTSFSVPAAPDRYALCARSMGIVPGKLSDEEASLALIRALKELNAKLQVPTPSSYGINSAEWEKSIPTMVKQAIASGSHANNPRVPTDEEIAALYRKVFV